MEKTNSFIKRLRWRAYHLDNPRDNETRPERYGFRSRAAPPANILLSGFEHDMFNMIKNIKFRNVNNEFQHEINKIRFIRE